MPGAFAEATQRPLVCPRRTATGAMSDLPMNSSSNVIISIEGHSGETERVDMIFCRGNALDSLRVSLPVKRWIPLFPPYAS